jgi:hypothetical protein
MTGAIDRVPYARKKRKRKREKENKDEGGV